MLLDYDKSSAISNDTHATTLISYILCNLEVFLPVLVLYRTMRRVYPFQGP